MVVATIIVVAMALAPAAADPLSGVDAYPDVAFLARNDVPFDAQTAASVAGALGAPIFITNPRTLSDAARDGIATLNPNVIVVAGGEAAISKDVADEAAAACDPDCTIDRRWGTGRDETAGELAKVSTDYGFDRPVLQGSRQVVGDVHVGGTLNVHDLTVQDAAVVAGLNADRVDGKHASDLLGKTDKAADSDLLDGMDSTELDEPLAWAHLTFSGSLVDAKGIQASMVSPASGNPGVICFYDLPFTADTIMVTLSPAHGNASSSYNHVTVGGDLQSIASGCPGGTSGFDDNAWVSGWNFTRDEAPIGAVYVWFN